MSSRPLLIVGVIIVILGVIAGVGYLMEKGTDSFLPPDLPDVNVPATSTPTQNPDNSETQATTTFVKIPTLASTTIDTTSWQLYVDNELGYALEHPKNLIVNKNAGVLTLLFPKNLYFHWPLEDTAKITVTVSGKCADPEIESELLPKETFVSGQYTFTRFVGLGAAAGNRYFEIIYDTTEQGRCYRLDFLDHGANGAGLYVESASLVKKYEAQHKQDLESVLQIATGIVKSLRILANER